MDLGAVALSASNAAVVGTGVGYSDASYALDVQCTYRLLLCLQMLRVFLASAVALHRCPYLRIYCNYHS